MSAALARLAKALIAITDGDPAALVNLAGTAGVSGYQARRAARQIAVSADAYLKLCAAAAIDPVTGEARPSEDGNLPLPDLDWNRVAIKVLLARMEGSSIRKLAKKWRVSHMTVARVKSQQPVNIDNFLTICCGLGVHPHRFVKQKPAEPRFHVKPSLLQKDKVVNA